MADHGDLAPAIGEVLGDRLTERALAGTCSRRGDREHRKSRFELGVRGAEQGEARARCLDDTGAVHHVGVRQIAVGQEHEVHRVPSNEIRQLFLRVDRDVGVVAGTGQLLRERALLDERNLIRGEAADAKLRSIAKEPQEVVEVAPRGAHDDAVEAHCPLLPVAHRAYPDWPRSWWRRGRFEAIVDRVTKLVSYAVAVPELIHRLRPLPHETEPPLHFDPRRVDSAGFIGLLHRFDEIVYARSGLSLPPWAFYDCAAIPGLVCGFAADAADVDPRVRDALAAGSEPLIPLSLFIAIPHLDRDVWLVYSIADISEVMPDAAPSDSRVRTLRDGIDRLGASRVIASTQWRSSNLDVFAELGPLELLAAWLPAHTDPATAVFRFASTPGAEATASRWLDPTDDAALAAIHAEIETSARIVVAGPATVDEGVRRIPIGEAGA